MEDGATRAKRPLRPKVCVQVYDTSKEALEVAQAGLSVVIAVFILFPIHCQGKIPSQ